MKTVSEVSRLTGVSVRTLQYYDRIGLLHPARYTEAGYRLYDDAALGRLQQILLYRELQFPLKEIKRILDSPDFDVNRALEQQITLLTMKKEHLENLILFARGIKLMGGYTMDFSAFDTSKLDDYAARAKEAWGHTPAYREYEGRAANRTRAEEAQLWERFMKLLAAFGGLLESDPAGSVAQAQVKRLQNFITEHFYTCTPEILAGLGRLYGDVGELSANIDQAGGPGTAAFASRAIAVYCGD